jgi:hypothetical protein
MSRLRTALAVSLLAVPMLTGIGAASAASTAATTYSAPQWFPLHDSQEAMDCYASNPGCPVNHRHADKAVTFLTHDSAGTYHNVNVYAAGAGIAHIGHSGMPQCTPTAGQPLGNWIWVDHGGGVVSRYAHLYAIKIKSGQQVYPTTVLAESGSSGESAAQCKTKYLNFQIQHNAHGAPNGDGYLFKTSYACAGTTRVTYPGYFSPYPTWNEFPKSFFKPGSGWQHMIPRGGHLCVPA